MQRILRRVPWLPWVLLVATVILVVAIAETGLRGGRVGTLSDMASVSSACARPELAPGDSLISVYIASVRNIVDPGAPNYCPPTDPRWGVLGHFPGDTTIVLEQGPYRVSVRLLGTPGDTLKISWAGRTYPIIAVYGGGVGWKQRYITVADGRHYMLPIQWDEHRRAWEAYGLERWVGIHGPHAPHEEDSLEGRCADCHREDAVRSGMVFVGTARAAR